MALAASLVQLAATVEHWGLRLIYYTDSSSTSDQGIDTSNLVPSTAGGEPQPAYAMEDVEQTKAAHEEEENDTYGLSDATER